jgi:hypothetical protein
MSPPPRPRLFHHLALTSGCAVFLSIWQIMPAAAVAAAAAAALISKAALSVGSCAPPHSHPFHNTALPPGVLCS